MAPADPEISVYFPSGNEHEVPEATTLFPALMSQGAGPAAYEPKLVKARATAAAILIQLFLVLPRTSSEQATHVCVASLHLDL